MTTNTTSSTTSNSAPLTYSGTSNLVSTAFAMIVAISPNNNNSGQTIAWGNQPVVETKKITEIDGISGSSTRRIQAAQWFGELAQELQSLPESDKPSEAEILAMVKQARRELAAENPRNSSTILAQQADLSDIEPLHVGHWPEGLKLISRDEYYDDGS